MRDLTEEKEEQNNEHSDASDDDEEEEEVIEPRLVSINKPDINFQQKFVDNYVSTTKYKFWNFLPKNLFEQFRRVANIYFLIIALITLTPISPVKPGAFLLALVVVLGATACKEGVEDWVLSNFFFFFCILFYLHSNLFTYSDDINQTNRSITAYAVCCAQRPQKIMTKSMQEDQADGNVCPGGRLWWATSSECATGSPSRLTSFSFLLRTHRANATLRQVTLMGKNELFGDRKLILISSQRNES